MKFDHVCNLDKSFLFYNFCLALAQFFNFLRVLCYLMLNIFLTHVLICQVQDIRVYFNSPNAFLCLHKCLCNEMEYEGEKDLNRNRTQDLISQHVSHAL